VSNPKLGNKHICKECETRFFDMKKTPAVCPKCGLEAKEPKPAKIRKAAVEAVAVVPPAGKEQPTKAATPEDGDDVKDEDDIDDELADLIPTDDDVTDEDILEDDEDDDGLIEDASDIGEDEDDLMEVRVNIDDGSTDKG